MKSIRFNVAVLIPIILFSLIAFNLKPALGYTINVSFDPTPVERNVGEEWAFDIIFNGKIGCPL